MQACPAIKRWGVGLVISNAKCQRIWCFCLFNQLKIRGVRAGCFFIGDRLPCKQNIGTGEWLIICPF